MNDCRWMETHDVLIRWAETSHDVLKRWAETSTTLGPEGRPTEARDGSACVDAMTVNTKEPRERGDAAGHAALATGGAHSLTRTCRRAAKRVQTQR